MITQINIMTFYRCPIKTEKPDKSFSKHSYIALLLVMRCLSLEENQKRIITA